MIAATGWGRLAATLTPGRPTSTAFAAADVHLSSGTSFFCSFSGGVNLYLTVQPGSTLEQIKSENPGGLISLGSP